MLLSEEIYLYWRLYKLEGRQLGFFTHRVCYIEDPQ